ncbi:MAG: DUF5320 domain-containing protein [Poseidonibacter sp.]
MPRGDGTGPMGMVPNTGRCFGMRNNFYNYKSSSTTKRNT